MALADLLLPCAMPLTLEFEDIWGPTHLFTNQALRAKLLDGVSSPANGRFVIVQGFEPCIYLFGTGSTWSIDIYGSPNAKIGSWVKLVTVTQASTVKALGRNTLGFPQYALAVDLTAVAGGNLSAVCYAERRK